MDKMMSGSGLIHLRYEDKTGIDQKCEGFEKTACWSWIRPQEQIPADTMCTCSKCAAIEADIASEAVVARVLKMEDFTSFEIVFGNTRNSLMFVKLPEILFILTNDENNNYYLVHHLTDDISESFREWFEQFIYDYDLNIVSCEKAALDTHTDHLAFIVGARNIQVELVNTGDDINVHVSLVQW